MKVQNKAILTGAIISAMLLSGCASTDSAVREAGNREMTAGGCVVQGDVRSRFRNRSEFRNHCNAVGGVAELARSTNVQVRSN